MTPGGHKDSQRSAPEGALCNVHPERPALATCPRCGHHACIECWHPPLDRCHPCLQRDPSAAAPPVPWEQRGVGVVRRVLDTMVTALQPVRTAPSFGRVELAAPVRFALAVTLPLALLRGIIPFTHTMRFGPSFAVTPLGHPSTAEMASDVLRAMGVSVLFTAVLLFAVGVPFVSLARSYGTKLAMPAALRVVLYRSWLLPAASQGPLIPGILFGLVAWGLPEDGDSTLVRAVFFIDMTLPLVLLLAAMRSTARLAGGVGPFASFLIVVVPLVLLLVMQSVVVSVAEPWVPSPRGGAESQLLDATGADGP